MNYGNKLDFFFLLGCSDTIAETDLDNEDKILLQRLYVTL